MSKGQDTYQPGNRQHVRTARQRRLDRPTAAALFCERCRIVRHLQPGGLTLAELDGLPDDFQALLACELPGPFQAIPPRRRLSVRRAVQLLFAWEGGAR